MRVSVIACLLLVGILALGCGGGPRQIGARTGCAHFLEWSADDQQRAILLMQQSKGKGTSPSEMATATDSARALCKERSYANVSAIYAGEAAGPTATGTSPAEAGPQFEPAHTFVIETEGRDGSTSRLNLEVADPVKAGDISNLGEYGGACEADPERDVRVLGQLKATNTTKTFASPVDVTFSWYSSDDAAPYGGVIEQDRGDDCWPGRGTSSRRYDLEAGESVTNLFSFVVHDYFSPANPAGDSDALDAYSFTVPSAGNMPTCISGPGVGVGATLSITGRNLRRVLERYNEPVHRDPLPTCASSPGEDSGIVQESERDEPIDITETPEPSAQDSLPPECYPAPC